MDSLNDYFDKIVEELQSTECYEKYNVYIFPFVDYTAFKYFYIFLRYKTENIESLFSYEELFKEMHIIAEKYNLKHYMSGDNEFGYKREINAVLNDIRKKGLQSLLEY